MAITLPSYAKINWILEILGKRPDGYHELRTILQTISVADQLTFSPIEAGIEIECDHQDVPLDRSNLVHKAATLLGEFTGIKTGVRIRIDKRIPTAAGLGGGSSNAAVTLIALQKMWNLHLDPADLFSIGSQLGADVPFFFMGGTCLGVGRGDEVYPLEDLPAQSLLLVNAGISVSSRDAYANLPHELTNNDGLAKMPLSLKAAYAFSGSVSGDVVPIWELLKNDLEIPVLPLHPLIGDIKQRLKKSGARGVLMSGSGSTVFGIFDSQEARSRAQSDLSDTGWWCAPAHTLGRKDYRKACSWNGN